MNPKQFTIGKVFSRIKNALEYLNKINKMLQSVIAVQTHASALVADLEKIWNKQENQPEL